MRKLILSLALSSIVIMATGQDCKFSVNKMDEINKKVVKQTKTQEVMSSASTKGAFAIQRYGDEYYVIMGYNHGTWKKHGSLDIKAGQEIIFLLVNGDKVTLKAYKDVNGIQAEHSAALNDVFYEIKKEDLEKLSAHGVKLIRFYRTTDGSAEFEDQEIKSKNMDDIQQMAKCII